jgi:hypothetical protein
MAKKKSNALEALLSANPDVQEPVYIKRLATDFVLKALNQDELTSAQEESTFDGVTNDTEMNNLIIAKSCVEPNFEDPTLLEHYGARDAGDCVKKALKVGEIVLLSQKVLEVSGFDTTLNQAKK